MTTWSRFNVKKVIEVLLIGHLLIDIASPSKTNDFQTINVESLSQDVYGTELVLLDNSIRETKSYRFEDFFWTGSGDGSDEDEDNLWTSTSHTVYETKTIVSTIYVEPTITTPTTENTTKCIVNCQTPTKPSEDITPTPTQAPEEDFLEADRHFWLLTVLKSDGKDPVLIDLKNSLAKLYKKAFERQQDRHLGINGRIKREHKEIKPVNVYIHNVNKTKLNGNDKIEVLYHVAVSGKPVAAITAAKDMSLVTDDEVVEELGYPFLIKAEPYLKPAEYQGLSTANNTWVFIGVSIVGLLLFLLFVAFLTLGMTKRKRQAAAGLDNRRHIFERGVGQDNKGFVGDQSRRTDQESPTYINYNQPINPRTKTNRSQSSMSSSSTSSASLDISPLMGLRKSRTPPKKPPRPKAALNKTMPLNEKRSLPQILDSDSSSSAKDSPDNFYVGNYDPGVISPKSYLSMPSVKSFPRGNMPEPLNKVLEPVSVLHLDMPNDDAYDSQLKEEIPPLTRYGSVGAVDPGVVGPIVWNMHRERLQHGVSVDEGIDDLKTANVSKMRKRFYELLDDTFSLFGSRKGTPESTTSRPIEVKSHSAVDRSSDEMLAATPKPRPKTTDPRKVSDAVLGTGPRGAWSSKAPSPLVRPLSAGIIYPPRINVDHVLAEGKFRTNDPAIPLIAAIKTEIEKCSLPGSTADLNQ